MSPFKTRVIQIVSHIPYGHVMSYGQVASYGGAPRGARQVGWILNQLDEQIELPWWRVVNNQGRISIKGSRNSPQHMKNMLEKEGLIIKDDLTFNIEMYRYTATIEDLKKWQLPEQYLELVNAKYLKF